MMDVLPLLFTSGDILSGSLPIFIAIAVALGAGITALFYILGSFLNHPPLIALAKEELAALIVTVIMIGGWLFFQGTLSQLTCAIAFGSCNFSSNSLIPPTHLGVAWTALEVLFGQLKNIYIHLYLYEVLIGFLSTVYITLGTFNPGLALLPVSFPPLVGLSILSNAHTALVEAIGMTMVSVLAKQQLIMFSAYAIPGVFLPLGLVFRAIPFLRVTGSSIISVCVALFFVFPLAVLLSNYMIFDLYKPVDMMYAPTAIGFCKAQADGTPPETALGEKAAKIEDVRKEWGELMKAPGQNEEGGALATLFNFARGIWNLVAGVAKAAKDIFLFMVGIFGEFTKGIIGIGWNATAPSVGVTSGLYYFIMEEVVLVSQFVVLVLVCSVFEIILTVTMYRNISLLIGGEMDLIGLSKLV